MPKQRECADARTEAAAVAAEFDTLCQRFNIDSGNSSPHQMHPFTPQLPSISQLSSMPLASGILRSGFEAGPPSKRTIPYCCRCGKLQYYSRIRGHLPPQRYLPVQQHRSFLSLGPSMMLGAPTECIVYRAHRHRRLWPSNFEPWLDVDALWHHHPTRSAETKRPRREPSSDSKPFLQRNIRTFSDT